VAQARRQLALFPDHVVSLIFYLPSIRPTSTSVV
jgi:hypothetical protein